MINLVQNHTSLLCFVLHSDKNHHIYFSSIKMQVSSFTWFSCQTFYKKRFSRCLASVHFTRDVFLLAFTQSFSIIQNELYSLKEETVLACTIPYIVFSKQTALGEGHSHGCVFCVRTCRAPGPGRAARVALALKSSAWTVDQCAGKMGRRDEGRNSEREILIQIKPLVFRRNSRSLPRKFFLCLLWPVCPSRVLTVPVKDTPPSRGHGNLTNHVQIQSHWSQKPVPQGPTTTAPPST